jgi:hypothetical protein
MLKRLLVALLGTVGLMVGLAGPAAAHHVGPFMYNGDPYYAHYVVYVDHNNQQQLQYVTSGASSVRGVVAFSVADHSRVLYRSLTTGALYWSGCGEDLTNAGVAGGWQYAGGGTTSFELIRTANYPTAPANVCG